MKRVLAICATALGAQFCGAQLSNERAVFEARRYVSAWAPDMLDRQPVVSRGTTVVRGDSLEYIQVYLGEASATLKGDGTFISFSVRGAALAPKGGHPDLFETDEATWNAFKDLLERVDLSIPRELEQHSVEREDREGLDYVFRLYMRLRPFGYEAFGHYLVAEVHRTTGRLLHLSIPGAGWTYEPPNVRVSESQAIEKAVETMGGAASEWRAELKYGTANYDSAPEYFKPLISQQIMRLLYRLQRYDAESRESSIMSIDSVTGAVISTQRLTIDSPPVEGTVARRGVVKDSRAGPKPSAGAGPADPKAKQGPPAPSRSTIMLLVAGSLLVVGGSAFLLRRGWAARRQ